MPRSVDECAACGATQVTAWVIADDEAAAGDTIAAVLDHTEPGTPVVLAVRGLSPRLIRGPQHPADGSADAVSNCRRCDRAVVTAPCVVPAGWLAGLRAAAHADPQIASAVAVDVNAQSDDVAALTARARATDAPVISSRRLLGTGAPCVYRRASAAQLTGCATSSARFETAARARGLAVVLAENVFVFTRPPATDLGHSEPALRDAIAAARRRGGGLSLLVDARALSAARDGTRTHLLELLGALTAYGRDRIAVTALVPRALDSETERRLLAMPRLTTVELDQGAPLPADLRADVAHRPLQVAADAELQGLRRVADRVVITHQDLISYHEPSYFPSSEAFSGYRAMTARALGSADAVLFFSDYVRGQALAERLIDPVRSHVVGLSAPSTPAEDGPPALRAPPADGEPYVLCLGSDYLHKNRPFALAVHAALRRDHGWTGRLVLAGPHVRWGSTADLERIVLAQGGLADSVRDVGEVTDAERDRLIGGAQLILYPTLQEGFGLVPFEAAARSRPCMWAAGSSLAEVLPTTAARIVPWDADATAEVAQRLLSDPLEAATVITAASNAADDFGPAQLADRLISAYLEACERPRSGGCGPLRQSEDATRLVGPGGVLPGDVERPLLALASHGRIARPVFAGLRAGYRLSRWAGRRSLGRR